MVTSRESKDALRLLPFSGKQEHWRQWNAKHLARAAIIGTYDALTADINEEESSSSESRSSTRSASAAAAELEKADRQAYAELLVSCSDIAFYIVEAVKPGAQRAARAFRELRNKYAVKSSARKTELRKLFSTARMAADQDPDVFIMELDYIRRQLADNGVDISDADFVTDIVVKLPDAYSELVTLVEQDLDDLSLADLQIKLRGFYRRKILSPPSVGPSPESALAARLASSHRPGGGAPSGGAAAAAFAGAVGGKVRCDHCKKLGHTIDKCFALHGYPPNWQPRKQRGKHTDRRKKEESSSGKSGDSGSSGAKAHVGFMAAEGRSIAMVDSATAGEVTVENWIIDSGCTSHMTYSADGMLNVRPHEVSVHLMDGNTAETSFIGDLPVIIHGEPITLYNVVVVPSMEPRQLSLLSVRKATAHGVTFTFGGSSGNLQCGDLVIPFETNERGLWAMTVTRSRYISHELCNLSAAGGIDINLLHQRLGHISFTATKALGSQLGVTVTGTPAPCVACELGKSRRAAISKVNTSPATEPLGLVHTDFAGPFRTPSRGGARYAQVVIDSATEVTSIIAHPSKESQNAKSGLEYFTKTVGRPLGLKVQSVRSDCGGEFTKDFDAICDELEIVHQKSPPYSQQYNGKAERVLQTLIQRASCMLQHAKLPQFLWGEALNTACYLYNRSPHSSLDGKTPYEAIMGVKPDIKHLRVFGTLCFLHIPKDKRGKFDARSIPCIFVGYAVNMPTGTYRIYNPATRHVVESIHVSFHEGTLYSDKQREDAERAWDEGEEKWEQLLEEELEQEPAGAAQPEGAAEPEGVDNSSDDGSDGEPVAKTRPPLLLTLPRSTIGGGGTLEVEGGGHSSYMAVTCDPTSLHEALSSPDAAKWQEAMHAEMTALVNMGTWSVVELSPGRKPIGTKWVFKTKLNSAGEMSRYKARLVVQGFTQVEGVDYFDTYAPVVNITTIRTLLACGAAHDWEMEQMDIDTAFLNAMVDEEIYVKMAPGYEQYAANGEPLVYRLHRSLYGLKQAPRNWNHMLNDWLVDSCGFRRCVVDTCLYVFEDTSSDEVLFVGIYVDDLAILTNSLQLLISFKSNIKENFNVKELGALEHFLGIRITRDRSKRLLTMDQTTYINSILEKYNMVDARPVVTPAAEGALTKTMTAITPGDSAFLATVPYRGVVGSLVYVAVMTRPDISNSVREVSRYMSAPGRPHWQACLRILRYLKGTADYKLTFDFSGATNMELVGYCDADHASDIDTRRSITGYIFFFGAAAISWVSRMQPTVAQSSTEAEYMALTEALNEAIHLRQLLSDLRLPQPEATTIFEDNEGAIKLASNPIHHRRTKHIDVKYHLIRDHVNWRTIKLVYINTKKQLADALTKGVDGATLRVLTRAIFTDA
jgi:transposase InsO family protein/ribonuclease HI